MRLPAHRLTRLATRRAPARTNACRHCACRYAPRCCTVPHHFHLVFAEHRRALTQGSRSPLACATPWLRTVARVFHAHHTATQPVGVAPTTNSLPAFLFTHPHASSPCLSLAPVPALLRLNDPTLSHHQLLINPPPWCDAACSDGASAPTRWQRKPPTAGAPAPWPCTPPPTVNGGLSSF